MTFETSLIFFISLILLWLKPGPGQALRLTYALRFGFLGAFCISLGVTSVCVGYFLFAALGYSVISNISMVFFTGLKVLGALYFIYLGSKGLLKALKTHATTLDVDTVKSAGYLKDYGLGLLMALSNPIPIFYFVGILPTLVPLAEMTYQDILVGALLIAAVGVVVDGLLLLLTVMTKAAFADGGFFKSVSIFTSVSFVMIGLFLLYSALFLQSGLEYSLN